VAGACECGEERSGSIKRGEFLDYLQTVSFSRRTLLHGVSRYKIISVPGSSVAISD
jgi:hypothetical protein